MAERVASIVVSLSLVDFEEEKERDSWGRRVVCMELFRLLNPVDASSLFLRGFISAKD
jgi:hypothetical protein